MAMNRVRNAFAPPRKGETFELRAGLVYVCWVSVLERLADNLMPDRNMPTNGKQSLTCRNRDTDYQYSKEAIQKTIMAMTLGKDVSQLFPDVLKNIATADLDQKKLVYLYLMLVPTATPRAIWN